MTTTAKTWMDHLAEQVQALRPAPGALVDIMVPASLFFAEEARQVGRVYSPRAFFELVESYHDLISTLTETYMSVVSKRMNEIMKTLTIISTIFVPLTFLAGVYGMNMPIPENQFHISYPIFWGVVLAVIGGMIWWFRSRHWF
jgi:Mg2+ and Co2+ transporter CorA